MGLPFFENALHHGVSQLPNDYYRELQQAYIYDQWDNTTAADIVQEQKIVDGKFVLWEYEDVEAWINTIVGLTTTGSKTGYDFTQLLFRDLDHELSDGRYYKFKGYTWLSYFDNRVADVISHISVRRCNNLLRIRDPETGGIKSYPCVVGYDMAAATPQVSTYVITPNNHATVMVQGNDETLRLFKTNTRVILSGRPFKLNGIQNTLEEHLDDRKTSMLTLDFYLDEIQALDDLENQVAYNGSYDYSIKLNSEDMGLTQGSTGQLTATVSLNGNEVQRDIGWYTTDSSVVTIDGSGRYEVVGAIGKSATIIAALDGNDTVAKMITITVVGADDVKGEIVIEPLFDSVREGQVIEFDIKAVYSGQTYEPTRSRIIAPNTASQYIAIDQRGNHVWLKCHRRRKGKIDLLIQVENDSPTFTAEVVKPLALVSIMG